MAKRKTPARRAASKRGSGMSDREIVLKRTFDAPRELVWDVRTNPAHIVHGWGPNGFTTTIERMDVSPGGS